MRDLVTIMLFAFLMHMSLISTEHCGPGSKYADGSCGLIVGRDLCPEMSAAAEDRIKQSQDLLGIPLCSLNLIMNENEYDKFFDMGGIQMLYFIQGEHRQSEVATFLANYNMAAKEVCSHGISMALVMCSNYKDPVHCASERRAKFVYTFRGGHEVDASSVEKFANVDSIVTPALQHALGGLVSIAQTPSERKELENQNLHKKDLIFGYIDSFSSPAHHYFLELAKTYKDKFSFALTTFRVGAAGLPKPDNFAKNPAVLWVLQCSQPARKEVLDERSVICPPTLYNGGHNEIHDFLATFRLSLYHEIQTEDLRHQGNPLMTPYDATDLPYAIFVYDSKSEGRVRDIVPGLAQFFRGNVAVHLVRQDVIKTQRMNEYLKLNVEELRPPAICFFKPGQDKAAQSISDFESPDEWLQEKLKKHLAEKSTGETRPTPIRVSEDTQRILTQDDELVSSMTCETTLTHISHVACPKELKALISNIKESAAIAFYLPYDPMSNKMLRLLDSSGSSLQDLNSRTTVHKFNCFDWTTFCDSLGITNFPTLSIFDSKGKGFVYDGALDSESITNAILISECSDNPKRIASSDALEAFLTRPDPSCQASRFITNKVVGIFPNERAGGNAVFASIAESHRREFLFGHVIDEATAKNRCPSPTGCIMISKPDDVFQEHSYISEDLRDKEKTLEAIRKSNLELLGPLDSRRELVISNIQSLASTQTHVVLILKSTPCKMKLKELSRSISGGQGSRDLASDCLGLMASVGRLASEISGTGLVFSYVDTMNPTRETILNDYKLSSERNHLIAIDGSRGQVSMFASATWTENSIRKWFDNILAKNVAANLVLPSGDWKPTLQGFDYISNLRKKFDQEDVKLFVFERAIGDTKVIS